LIVKLITKHFFPFQASSVKIKFIWNFPILSSKNVSAFSLLITKMSCYYMETSPRITMIRNINNEKNIVSVKNILKRTTINFGFIGLGSLSDYLLESMSWPLFSLLCRHVTIDAEHGTFRNNTIKKPFYTSSTFCH